MALALSWRGSKWGSASALGLFAFWLTIMTLIWLFLLGIAKVISGHFTPVEIALTISIGVCCLGGALSATQGFKNRAIVPASAICASFLVLQTAALWLSMRPQFARI
jgi:hypothetical protein